jgi:hypothetical protein
MNHGKMKKNNDLLKENTFAFPDHLANSMQDITPLFGSNLVIFCGHIGSAFFQMSSKWLSVREEHYFKTITFFKMNIISKSCHRPHSEPQRAACSLWTICCAGLQ